MARVVNEAPPEHGGNIAQAAERYSIPLSDWLDLSAALNPEPYPPTALNPSVFQHLPLRDDALRDAAARYYFGAAQNGESIVAAPGSQALIQWLPLLRSRCRVAVPAIGYREHAFRWRWAGHDAVEYDPRSEQAIDELLQNAVDVLVVINPNNPLTNVHSPDRLYAWLQTLQQRQGWLVVDEAFADVQPAHSMAAMVGEPGLIVLRSLGKFFGLAGLRCGFALCEPALANALRVALGPWPVSGPTAVMAEHALRDIEWHKAARSKLREHGAACAKLLESMLNENTVRHAGLFTSVILSAERARAIQNQLACAGIWVRRIELDADEDLLRFGVVAQGGADWLRLRTALQRLDQA